MPEGHLFATRTISMLSHLHVVVRMFRDLHQPRCFALACVVLVSRGSPHRILSFYFSDLVYCASSAAGAAVLSTPMSASFWDNKGGVLLYRRTLITTVNAPYME
jgi:hypothetical protein